LVSFSNDTGSVPCALSASSGERTFVKVQARRPFPAFRRARFEAACVSCGTGQVRAGKRSDADPDPKDPAEARGLE
jgi:hypothetical protein